MTSIAASAALTAPQQGDPKPDLWEEALNVLSAEDRHQFDDSSTSQHETLQKVHEATENAKEACVAKGWNVYHKRNGDKIKLRHILERLSVWVESAIKVIDLGVSFDQSGHAALPWGVVKFIVTMGKSNIELFSNIVEQVESISCLIARYAVIEKLYLEGASEAKIGLRESITKFYAAILTYLARAKSYFSGNTLKQIGRGLLEVTRNHYDAAKVSETEVHKWMEAVDREFDLETAKLVTENYEVLQTILRDFNKPITGMAVRMRDLHDNFSRGERTKVFNWLSKIDYERHHDDLSKHMLPNTGQWLFDSQPFVDWGQSSVSSILWLHGIPGSGKTRLVSRIIDVMRNESTPNRSPIAFFYCARSTAEPERGKPVEVLGAILKQLCSSEPDEPIRNSIAREYAARIRKADYDYSRIRKLSVEDCTGLILELTKDNPATIVVDALDECDEQTRYELLEALDKIIADSLEIVKVVVSSRVDVDIKLHLEHCNNISISADRNESDIARFVLSEVDRLISKKLLLDGRVHKKLKKRIIETSKSGAQGMFRWVAMSLETLQQIKFRQDFENRLGRLPSKLSGLYDIIHSEIIRSEDDQTIKYGRVAATKTLKWLLCAQRLLTVEELAAAIQLPYDEAMDSSSASDDSENTDDEANDQAIDSSSSSDDSNQKSIETKTRIEDNIIRLCRNLVVVDSERKVFRFAHQSVREYLLTRKEYTDIEQHALVVERCFEIYEVETSPGPAEPSLTRQNELLKQYARGYWPVHYKYLDDSGSQGSRMRFRKFMIQESERLSPYMQWLVDVANSFGSEDSRDLPFTIRRSLGLGRENPLPFRLAYALAEPHTPLSMICAFGLSSMLNELDFLPVEVNQLLKWKWRSGPGQDIEYEFTTPLTIASDQGHAQVIRRLLDKGATINISDESYESPLLAAIYHSLENIVQMLLENGADIKAKCNINAWWVACDVKSEHILKLLLERGADVNALDSDGESALVKASGRGQESIVRFLLEQKADVNVMNLSGPNALRSATMGGYLSVVLLLLGHGVDVNARDRPNRTSLHWASRRSLESIAKVLLEYGADVNARDENEQTPLHYASEEGFESVVQILLDSEADVNARNIKSETPLHRASSKGVASVVRLLLKHRAEIHARDSSGRSSLHLAAEIGDESVRVLLDREADINARDNFDRTPLHSASGCNGRTVGSVVRLLLDRGADINARDSSGRSPLHLAAGIGDESVRVLLDREADINARDNYDKTPLHSASECNGRTVGSVVRLLLDRGAYINARDSGGRSPLHSAARKSSVSALRVLLDHGIDVSVRDNDGQTPLHHASKGNNESVVQLLLEHGADVNARDNEDRAPLHSASDSRWKPKVLVSLLLGHGAEIHARDSSGRNPLHLAAKLGNISAVPVLLDHGADINAHDDDGRTPLDLARRGFGDHIVPLLLQQEAIDHAKPSEEEVGKENKHHSAEEEQVKAQSGEESESQGEERSKERKDSPSEADKDEPVDVAEA